MSGNLNPAFVITKNWVTLTNWHLWLTSSILVAMLALDVGLESTHAQSLTSIATQPIFAQNVPTRPVLKPGSSGEAVVELQATLKLLGFYQGSVDGIYDQATVKAVSRFQTAAGLKSDGITGKATWNRLFPPSPDANATPSGTSAQPAPPSSMAGGFPQPQAKPIAAPPNQSPINRRPVMPQTGARREAIALPVLKLGMRGPAVVSLQERLRLVGVYRGSIDGVFGKGTETAVKTAQRKFNLKPDGVVGAATWNVLLR